MATLAIRVASALRSTARRIEKWQRSRDRFQSTWERNRAAKLFVKEHSHLGLEELTDLALKRGVYSASQPRRMVLWKMHRITSELIARGELLKS